MRNVGVEGRPTALHRKKPSAARNAVKKSERGLFDTGNPPQDGHLKKATLIEEYWIPAHNARRESHLFQKNKKILRDELQLPCWVCRTRGGPRNQLEVHHIFEWSLWNAMDPKRVTRILEVLEFYEDGYVATARNVPRLKSLLDAAHDEVDSPDDIRNLVVLCQKHHRSRFTGVHMVSFPIWLALSAVRPDFQMVRDNIVRIANHIRRLDEAVSDIVMPPQE